MSYAYEKDKINLDALESYLETCDEGTKIYIGCDSKVFKSKRFKKTWIDYVCVVIVHRSARNGCKVFASRERIEDVSNLAGKNPTHRLLSEVQKAGELYQEIQHLILDYEVEIHLDLNPDEKHKSSVAAKAALGYIRSFDDLGGHFIAKTKPDSFAATNCADRLFRGKKARINSRRLRKKGR